MTLGKRQRTTLVFDEQGRPTHVVAGVSTTLDGIRWGDGWTVIQPVNRGLPASGGACANAKCGEDEVQHSICQR